MKENESGMLEKWVELLNSGMPLNASVFLLSTDSDYSNVFIKIKEGMESGSNFSKAMLDNKDSFSYPTVILARVGEYSDRATDYDGHKNGENDCLIKTLKKAKDLAKLIENHNPDKRSVEEILLCSSVAELIGEGIPILVAFTSTADNFAAFNCYSPESALRYIHSRVRLGANMCDSMAVQSFFHPESVYLASIGENSGDLDKTLRKASEVLEFKIKHNLQAKQTEDILFYYGLGMMTETGIPFMRSMEILNDSFKLASFGSCQQVLGKIITDNHGRKPIKKILEEYDYFTPEVLSKISGDENNLEKELMDISDYFTKKYCK
jgi:type II secretory pathway component PulF